MTRIPGIPLASLLALLAACAGDDGAATTAGSTTGDDTTSGSTTGEAFCGLDDRPADGAWIELQHKDAPLLDGSPLAVECGFQGLYMFEIVPLFGGFTPLSDHVYFDYYLDIDGENDGPMGHYTLAQHYPIFVGCETEEHDPLHSFRIILEAAQADLELLDTRPAHFHVDMTTPDGTVSADVDVLISAPKGQDWAFCEGTL